jgi:hypothetical protein
MESILKFRPFAFILAVLLVVGVVAAAYFILPNIGRPANPAGSLPAGPSASATVPAGWLVYRDPQAGFSFRYPEDAHLEVDSNELHPYAFIRVAFADPAQGSLIVDVRENRAKQLPEAFAAQAYAEVSGETPPPGLLGAKEVVTVGNKQASRYAIPATLTDFMLYVPLNDKMLVIYPGSAQEEVAGQLQGSETFSQVLGTFQFTDQ